MNPTAPFFAGPSFFEGVYLSHCGIAPLLPAGAAAARAWDEAHMSFGAGVFARLGDPTAALHAAAGELLGVPAADLSFTRNTAEGLSMVANGLPLQPGDRIVSYVHEYPSNHYPWRLQETRGAKLELLPDRACGSGLPEGRPRGFELADLETLLRGGNVRVVAVSHVQFTSGFTADLAAIGQLCRAHGAWFVVDAAQSLGVLPLCPLELGIDALAAPGWKWLRGPIGTGLLYTSPRLRAALRCTMAGANLMQQGQDYLNHAWQPFTDGRFFEYSTADMAHAAALAACLRELPLRVGLVTLAQEAARLRQVLAEGLDPAHFQSVRFPGTDGPIQSWVVARPEAVARHAGAEGVTVTVRGGYLRTAPHGYQTEAEMARAVEVLNRAAQGCE
jgi:cysteine desulfurase/selenocysteine lyase